MKALSTTILIVVTAVVILVAALVVLTIFGGGVGSVAQTTDKRNNCLMQCTMSCETINSLPPTWSVMGCDQFSISKEACHCCDGTQRWCKIGTPRCAAPADCK